MKLLYVAQFHETCGYTHAAHGYIKSLDSIAKLYPVLEIKIISVSLDPKKLSLEYHQGKTDKHILNLLDKYHFSNQEEFDSFVKDEYCCIWHMTSILPEICKREGVGSFYKSISASLSDIIHGAEKNYHILAWETDTLCNEYQACIKKYKPEVIFAPSKWNQEVFSKISKSVFLPHLIEKKADNQNLEKVNLPFDTDKSFCILSVSEWTKRKNFESLIRAFMLEFHDKPDAYLVIKTSLPSGVSKEQFIKHFNSIKETIRVHGNANLVVMLDYISKNKMDYLYSVSDLFALTSFGEGFSLPTSEAAKNKLPILCPKEGGHVDYLSKQNRYFVEGMWDVVVDAPPYDPDGNWYIPSITSIRKKMNLAYQDWKSGGKELKNSAELNTKELQRDEFSHHSIGKTIVETIVGGCESKEKNSRISLLKKSLKNKTLKQKIDSLENLFKGEDCYILNCGPSLGDYDPTELSNFLKDKLVLSVKQAYNLFHEVTDFHFFNCSNLPKINLSTLSHYEYDNETISVASSNYSEYLRWALLQDSDVFFKIPIRTEINNEFLVRTGKIDEFLMKNSLTRPCGPGIMYETVLFFAIHLGVKSITCIGWDLTNKKVNEESYQHFYGSSAGLVNRGDILDWEIEETKKFSKTFFEWCEKSGISLKLASKRSALYEGIPRIDLKKEFRRT